MKVFLYDNREEKSKRDFYEKLKALEPGEYVVDIQKNHTGRSINQNRYYRMVLKIIATASGEYDEDRLHELMKKKFNGYVMTTKNGPELVGDTTSRLNVPEFIEYVKRVKMWAKDEYGIVIPEKEDADYKMWMDIQNEYRNTFRG